MQKDYVQVEGNTGLVRDNKSGAIININKSEAEKARRIKEKRLQKKKQEAQLRDDVDDLKSEINDIKSLLTQLVEKL